MTTKKLLMFAVAGTLLPVAVETADAGVSVTKIVDAPKIDLAPVTGNPPRLRRTDNEHPGNEHPAFVVFPNGDGLYWVRATEINGALVARTNNADEVQGIMVPFKLGVDASNNVIPVVDSTKAVQITTNNANEDRTFNHAAAFPVGDDAACVKYNYQPQNENNTDTYLQCFSSTGTRLLAQTKVFEKNNDNCDMTQSGGGNSLSQVIGNQYYFAAARGCNGNGSDNQWLQSYTLTKTATAITFKNNFDVTILNNEERSHGACSFGLDPNVAICTGTDGNNQLQRNGVHVIAVDVTPGKFNGPNQNGAILWRQQVGGRVQVDGRTTYAVRIAQSRVLDTAGKTTDEVFLYWNQQYGNNTDNRKGGTTSRIMMGGFKATKTGLSISLPVADMSRAVVGLGGTHLHQEAALFGDSASPMPGFQIGNGSMVGGGFNSTSFAVGWDKTANKLVNLGSQSYAPSDIHMYSNYLGNNPGNQGRNFLASQLVKNPIPNHPDTWLLITASTAKSPETAANPAIKLTGYLTIQPAAKKTPGTGGGNGNGDGNGGGNGGTDTDGDGDVDSDDAGSSDTTLGGCSTGGSTGLATFLLIGLAAFIRRRR